MRKWVRRLAGERETDAEFLIGRCARLGGRRRSATRCTTSWASSSCCAPARARRRGPPPSSPGSGPLPSRPLRRERPDVRAELARPPLAVREVGRARRPAHRRAGARRDDHAPARPSTRSCTAIRATCDCSTAATDCSSPRSGCGPSAGLLLESVYAYLTLMNGRADRLRADERAAGQLGDRLQRLRYVARRRGGLHLRPRAGAHAGLVRLGHVHDLSLPARRRRQHRGSEVGRVVVLPEARIPRAGTGSAAAHAARARGPAARRVAPHAHRVLSKLAAHNVYWSSGRQRDDVIGIFPLSSVGLAVTDYLAAASARSASAASACAPRMRPRCSGCAVRVAGRWMNSSPGGAGHRWFLVLPGVGRWPAADKAALVAVVRAKGGRRESDFVRLFDRHARLRRSLRRLVASVPDPGE